VPDLERALIHNGMSRRPGRSIVLVKSFPGGPTLITRLADGAEEYSDSMLAEVAKQLALASVDELRALVGSTLSTREWDDLVNHRCPGGINPYIGLR
jgi:hypothetical protein